MHINFKEKQTCNYNITVYLFMIHDDGTAKNEKFETKGWSAFVTAQNIHRLLACPSKNLGMITNSFITNEWNWAAEASRTSRMKFSTHEFRIVFELHQLYACFAHHICTPDFAFKSHCCCYVEVWTTNLWGTWSSAWPKSYNEGSCVFHSQHGFNNNCAHRLVRVVGTPPSFPRQGRCPPEWLTTTVSGVHYVHHSVMSQDDAEGS